MQAYCVQCKVLCTPPQHCRPKTHTAHHHPPTDLVPSSHHDSGQVLAGIASNGQHDDGQEPLGDARCSAGPLNGTCQIPAAHRQNAQAWRRV
jgi:hypothetical protein